jgi:hypothetical protein
MKTKRIFGAIAILFCFAEFASAVGKPRVFVLDMAALQRIRGDAASREAADREARSALKTKIESVVTKQATPPSGDKHDYMSQAPYFWPDPTKKDGLPYIRKDGERNPEIKRFPDHDLMDRMISTVEKVAIGYYATANEEYAKRAAEVLRLWFVDPATKMNPNLDFGQAIPGVNTGRGIGIIETRGLSRVVDAIGLLEGSKSWSTKDQGDLEAWFAKYLYWLQTSKNGLDEAQSKNNHGTYYDVQVASLALFVRKDALAKTTLENAKSKRIAVQIEPDGKQPLELERTKSFSYSTMNLQGLVTLAALGDAAGVDLWSFQTKDGRGIRKAIDYLYPFAVGEAKWQHKQIEPMAPESLYVSIRRAASAYKDAAFQKMMAGVPPAGGEVRSSTEN